MASRKNSEALNHVHARAPGDSSAAPSRPGSSPAPVELPVRFGPGKTSQLPAPFLRPAPASEATLLNVLRTRPPESAEGTVSAISNFKPTPTQKRSISKADTKTSRTFLGRNHSPNSAPSSSSLLDTDNFARMRRSELSSSGKEIRLEKNCPSNSDLHDERLVDAMDVSLPDAWLPAPNYSDFGSLPVSTALKIPNNGVPVRLRTASASEAIENATIVSASPKSDGTFNSRFVKHDPGAWDFYDERMINFRRLLQLTFLVDMFTQQQAGFNRWLGLSKRSRLFSDDPRNCRGFGTVFRWVLYVLCIGTCTAACTQVTFILPTNSEGAADYTQLPIKLTFLVFGIEVFTTMLCFSRAAKSFASLPISHATVRKVSTGLLLFCCPLFWLSYSVVFFSFVFFDSAYLARQNGFPSDMYRMHKNWIGHWVDEPLLLLLYAAAMFVAFSVYIVSNTVFGFYIWCIWMQVRKLTSEMEKNNSQFKMLLIETIPKLINEQKHLKLQWRVQIVIYIALDVILLLCFSLELQFIIFNGRECRIASTPILLYMFNIFIHLFSFLFGIAILNNSFSSIEDAAWKYTGWNIAPHLRTPEQASACKDPEVAILLLGLSTNRILFRIGPAIIDWSFISTVSGLAATVYGLAIPSLGALGNDRVCQ